jgi:branched-chain amino acid transport system substrate-binding protein
MLQRPAARRACGALYAVLLCAVLAACAEPVPLTVGFIGPLEGHFSDLGVQGRNGLTLALEEINAAGGVLGRPLRLLARDDSQAPGAARAAVLDLAGQGVLAVVGPMTSAQTVAALPAAEEVGMVLLSPTTSTPLLSGRRDHFFRVIPAATTWARGMARHCLEQDGLDRIALLTDMDNEAYAAPYSAAFAEQFTAGGGTVVAHLRVLSSRAGDWADAARALGGLGVPAAHATLSARDLAALARQLRHQGHDLRLYSSMWACTNELLQAAGDASEGLHFSTCHSADNPRPAFQDFARRYSARFGWEPNFAATLGYECGLVLAEGLRRAGGDPARLPDALTSLDHFPAVASPLGIDQFGDVRRPSFIVTVAGRTFRTIATIDEP